MSELLSKRPAYLFRRVFLNNRRKFQFLKNIYLIFSLQNFMRIKDQVFGNKLKKYKLLKRNLVEVIVFNNYKYKLISVSICNTDRLIQHRLCCNVVDLQIHDLSDFSGYTKKPNLVQYQYQNLI